MKLHKKQLTTFLLTLQTKWSTIYLSIGLFFYKNLAFAMDHGDMPTDITTNTSKIETGIAWALKIGGAGAVIWGCVSYARNKLQGEAVDTIVKLAVGLGAATFALGWWLGKSASASSAFLF